MTNAAIKSPSELAPSTVRKIILEEHSLLRTKLAEIETAIKAKDSSNLSGLARDMLKYLIAHLGNEDKILRPAIKDIDAWGDVRVAKMNKEHAEQRHEIETLLETIKADKISQYLPALQKFIENLLLDMNQEEKDLLSSDLLKDDPVTVGTFSG